MLAVPPRFSHITVWEDLFRKVMAEPPEIFAPRSHHLLVFLISEKKEYNKIVPMYQEERKNVTVLFLTFYCLFLSTY